MATIAPVGLASTGAYSFLRCPADKERTNGSTIADVPSVASCCSAVAAVAVAAFAAVAASAAVVVASAVNG